MYRDILNDGHFKWQSVFIYTKKEDVNAHINNDAIYL